MVHKDKFATRISESALRNHIHYRPRCKPNRLSSLENVTLSWLQSLCLLPSIHCSWICLLSRFYNPLASNQMLLVISSGWNRLDIKVSHQQQLIQLVKLNIFIHLLLGPCDIVTPGHKTTVNHEQISVVSFKSCRARVSRHWNKAWSYPFRWWFRQVSRQANFSSIPLNRTHHILWGIDHQWSVDINCRALHDN